jgi:bacterioferritin
MKGNDQIIAKLNFLLADELTAISQYMVQAEMCANWGYKELAEVIEKRAIDEMKHAENHIGRIIVLEGLPVVSELNKIHVGEDVETHHKNYWEAENGAIHAYNDAIKLAVEVGDNGTREMLESILKDEEDHIDWIEAQMDQIKQMSIQVYLSEQIS